MTWVLDKEQAEGAARLLKAAEGVEINVWDAEKQRDEEREESAWRLVEVEAEGLLEDAKRGRSEEDLSKLAVGPPSGRLR